MKKVLIIFVILLGLGLIPVFIYLRKPAIQQDFPIYPEQSLTGVCKPTYKDESGSPELTAKMAYSDNCLEKQSVSECLSVDFYNQANDDFVTSDGVSDCKWYWTNVNKDGDYEIFCGTIDGLECPEDYTCKLDREDIDDDAGTCIKMKITPTVRPIGDISTKENCGKEGGVWGTWGLRALEYCQIPSNDFEKDCTDGDQCQYGKCIAGGEDEIPGKCQKFPQVFGCLSYIEEGKISVSKLCID